MQIAIINGPNLNLLGTREPEIYGQEGLEEVMDGLRESFPDIQLDHVQSNIEGELIDAIQKYGSTHDLIVLNAGGYTHTSVAIADAVAAVQAPLIELHISNVYAREDYRHVSLMAKNCMAVIAGLGVDGYRSAIDSFLRSKQE